MFLLGKRFLILISFPRLGPLLGKEYQIYKITYCFCNDVTKHHSMPLCKKSYDGAGSWQWDFALMELQDNLSVDTLLGYIWRNSGLLCWHGQKLPRIWIKRKMFCCAILGNTTAHSVTYLLSLAWFEQQGMFSSYSIIKNMKKDIVIQDH